MGLLSRALLVLLVTSCTETAKARTVAVDSGRLVQVTAVVEAPEILEQSNELLKLSYESSAPIYILLNSPGGSVYAGLQFISAMRVARARGVELHCIVPGIAMSMAFQFLLECTHRYALHYSLLLFHPVRVAGLMLLTPETATDLAKDLVRTEDELLPTILSELVSHGMSREEVIHHYRLETTWTASGLAAEVPGFLEVIDDLEGLEAVWYTDKMVDGMGSIHPLGPSGGRPEIRYEWDGGRVR